jgi:hypothetical protein
LFDDLAGDEDATATEQTALVPLAHGDEPVYLSVRRLGRPGDEDEISARVPSLEDVLNKVTSLAGAAVEGLRDSGASKISVEFGCEFALESGQLLAIISKASGKSTFKIGLEWSRPTDRT